MPLRLPQLSRWVLAVLVAGLCLGFVPEYRSEAYKEEQRVTENIKDTGKHLSEIAKRIEQKRPAALPETQKAMEKVQELGELMKQNKLTRDEALKNLTKVTDQVKKQVADLRKDPAIQRMQEAARRQPDGVSADTPENMAQKMEALQKKLGTDASSEEMNDLKKKLEEFAKAASEAASKAKAGDADAQATLDKMAQSMDSLAEMAKEMGLDLQKLQDAMDALKEGKAEQFFEDMEAAMIDLEKFAQMAKEKEKMKLSFDMTGKDLPDRLELGQALPAIARLQKMARELQSGQMLQEDMDALKEELQRSLDPSAPYGQVPQHLQQALNQLEMQDKQGAADSLMAAAKEIENLLKQCGDCESMSDLLKACQAAGLCIGNCQGWGQCMSPPKAGMGGKPGRGVGTWSDASRMMEETANGFWSNEGLERPDLEGKGQTERGDPAVDGRLIQTKVKGQMQPGAPMPSITIKGLNIKGTSSVEYQEAVTAAQSEAQGALSQEKVPRAYQGTVKDYFDDLK